MIIVLFLPSYLLWFRFKINFCFLHTQPMGVLVLENYAVNAEPNSISFAFGITFTDETDKKHVFTARTERDMERWIQILREAR